MKATGSQMQLARQIGEHAVTAELGRRGYLATPFAGNVRDFDILAAGDEGIALPIQVKAVRGASWQLDAKAFLTIEHKDGRQFATAQLPSDLWCIFVMIGSTRLEDTFYIFQKRDLQAWFESTYAPTEGRLRPKNAASTHCAVWPRHIEHFKDNWESLERALGRSFLTPAASLQGI